MRLNKGLIVACLMFGLPAASFGAKFNQDDLFKTVPSQSQTITPASAPAATLNAAGAFANTVSSIKDADKKAKARKFLPIANAKIAEEPNNAQYYLARAQIYRDLEDYQLALKDVNRSLELKPSNQIAYEFRAAIYGQLLDWSSSLRDINKAIEIGPQKADLFQSRATNLLFMERFQEALAAIDRSIAMDSSIASSYAIRGSARFHLHNYKGAQEDLLRAESMEPGNALAARLRSLLQAAKRN